MGDRALAISQPIAIVQPAAQQAEADAERFGRVLQRNWEGGLLVARSVKLATNRWDSGENSPLGRISARRFGEVAGVDHKTVTAYLKAWNAAAAEGLVPAVEDLEPGQDVPLPTTGWDRYYGSRPDADAASDEWYTPKWLFDALGLTYDCDVCSPVDRTHVVVPALSWFTELDDGLAQEWGGLCWCNPPYSAAEPWVHRMIQHGNGLLLTHVPMNGEWMLDVWAACDSFRLFQGMDFMRPDGNTQRPAWWLCLSAFGDTAHKALEEMKVPDDLEYRRAPTHPLPGGRQ